MTEADWLACKDPGLMLVFLEGNASQRKARLFACGVGRSLWPFLSDERSHRLIDAAERHADHAAADEELETARRAAEDAIRGPCSRIVTWVGDRHAWQAARVVAGMVHQSQGEHAARDWSGWVTGVTMTILRCVFGNPFRSCTLDPSWLTRNVISLAQATYDERTFDRMPELANALEWAGCSNADILAHCRGPRPHFRGCWVLDLILGKE